MILGQMIKSLDKRILQEDGKGGRILDFRMGIPVFRSWVADCKCSSDGGIKTDCIKIQI